ncbi:MAG: Ribosome hibernation protein YhbH [uncultured Thiotrichaceae bacterium]|uniref:Ribosome hibernation promoting factor n=1 Tax=uncultured Thiotrichaceae bacterium TaxID=298394 RepID=A0A6S6TBX1_9GAMM|nr:MAG: Ribosome hibernation protein YhbH [uncultured Thiotrichaceae bacterium]
MQLEITGHHIDVTSSMHNYAQEKISKLKRHFDQVLDVHMILKVKKLEHTAEAVLHLSGNRVFADATSHDMYAAIDSLADKLDRQVIKYKEKVQNHHRSEGTHRNIDFG